ncbi:MAG: response regulator transcription factor [Anaerolineae bacterium]|nr:response regulator transcription factor [Anaerolineae bacterium]
MSIKVLLVDDHATVRDGLRFLLDAQSDITVVDTAANGRQATRLVAQTCPDVVIMDIAMPELNGIEATQQIKAECPHVQVIILSMYSSSEQIFRALLAGASGYLLKETAGLEVAAAVRAIRAGQRYLSAEISDKLIEEYVQQRLLDEINNPLMRLSPREREVLQLVVEGKSNAEIAELLSLSYRSVETYRHRLMRKLEITNLPDLVKFAISHGITSLELSDQSP